MISKGVSILIFRRIDRGASSILKFSVESLRSSVIGDNLDTDLYQRDELPDAVEHQLDLGLQLRALLLRARLPRAVVLQLLPQLLVVLLQTQHNVPEHKTFRAMIPTKR